MESSHFSLRAPALRRNEDHTKHLGSAGPDEFRAAPLWGLGQRLFFLHDGRTNDLLQAIEAPSGIASDNEKAEILSAAAKASTDSEVRSAVQREMGKLHSDSDYRRVANVLLSGKSD